VADDVEHEDPEQVVVADTASWVYVAGGTIGVGYKRVTENFAPDVASWESLPCKLIVIVPETAWSSETRGPPGTNWFCGNNKVSRLYIGPVVGPGQIAPGKMLVGGLLAPEQRAPVIGPMVLYPGGVTTSVTV
jgi:hypothetical protein